MNREWDKKMKNQRMLQTNVLGTHFNQNLDVCY